MDLSGKMALVTGGASGIGLASTKALLQSGVQRVAILDLNEQNGRRIEEQLCTEHGQGAVVFIKTDVSKTDELEAGFQTAVDTLKRLDIVINNAGIGNDKQWQLEIAINLGAVVQGTLLAMRHMGRDQGGQGGAIVNMASILGLDTMAGMPVYVATKHAVVGFSRSLGMPFHADRTGVRVMALCPGVTITGMAVNPIGNFLRLEWEAEGIRELRAESKQGAEVVGDAVVELLKRGESGGVWVIEGAEPVYEVAFPDRRSMKVAS